MLACKSIFAIETIKRRTKSAGGTERDAVHAKHGLQLYYIISLVQKSSISGQSAADVKMPQSFSAASVILSLLDVFVQYTAEI